MGLSFGKLVVLAILILVVWYGFKYASRVEAVRQALKREMAAQRERARTQAKPGPTLAAEDLVKCNRCGSYVAAHAAAGCGRADCPYRR